MVAGEEGLSVCKVQKGAVVIRPLIVNVAICTGKQGDKSVKVAAEIQKF